MVRSSARARAPASIANLGPLFDVAGLAVSYAYDRVSVEVLGQGSLRVEVYAEGAPAGERNTAYHAAMALLREADEKLHVRITVWKGVPTGYGLGSSGATAAATVYALNSLLGVARGWEELVRWAGEGERASAGEPHYDNVAASLLGGLVLVSKAGGALHVYRVVVPAGRVRILLFMPCKPPEVEAKTAKARAVLPRSIELRRVVEWLGEASRLALAVARGLWEEAARAMCYGGPIEEARSSLIPCYWEAKNRALEAGAYGFNISGAGPTLFAVAPPDRVEDVREAVASLLQECWGCIRIAVTEPDNRGCTITD